VIFKPQDYHLPERPFNCLSHEFELKRHKSLGLFCVNRGSVISRALFNELALKVSPARRGIPNLQWYEFGIIPH
jgi:hypothetical protein